VALSIVIGHRLIIIKGRKDCLEIIYNNQSNKQSINGQEEDLDFEIRERGREEQETLSIKKQKCV